MSIDTWRAWIEVDLGALVRNARSLGTHAGVPLLPMVKADAYGLGAVAVARALEAVRPWGYGVATIEEGAELRAAGIERPIIIFTPILPGEIAATHAARLTPALGRAEMITAWARGTAGAPWHSAIDTGMGRSGARWDGVAAMASSLAAFPPQGACTHFSAADRDDGSLERQTLRFVTALDALPARPPVLHAENSAAIERLGARSMWTVVRPGLFLYGVGSCEPGSARAHQADGDTRHEGNAPPTAHGEMMAPEPVVAMRARVVDVRTIEAGDTVSYWGTYRAEGTRRIATVPVGYADGYRRAFGNIGHAILRGCRVAVVGVVTMDMTMLDVSDVVCAIGDVVTLLGPAPGAAQPGTDPVPAASIDLSDAARSAGLSPYELLTGLRLRLPRVHVGVPDA